MEPWFIRETAATSRSPAIPLLPTPAVNDMGAGKTPEQWDEWTGEMREKHGNGNGHGRSLAIETQRLLPTPSASDSTGGEGATREARQREGQTGGPTLRDVGHLLPTPMSAMYEQGGDGGELRAAIQHGPTRRLPGASTSLPSDAGNTPPEHPSPGQLTIEDA